MYEVGNIGGKKVTGSRGIVTKFITRRQVGFSRYCLAHGRVFTGTFLSCSV